MKEIREGLFELEEKMPCAPEAITVDYYVVHAVQGYAEREEAAARILSFSKQLDMWVGVSGSCLSAMMQEDLEANLAAVQFLDDYFEELYRFEEARAKYYRRRRTTLGVCTLFVPRPTVRIQEVDITVPDSLIFMFGIQSVITGIRELINEGMLRIVRNGEGEYAFDVLFPTRSLVSHMMQKQHDAANFGFLI